MGLWEVPGFIQGWETQAESKILSFRGMHSLHPPWLMVAAKPFFKMFIWEGLRSNWDSEWELAF